MSIMTEDYPASGVSMDGWDNAPEDIIDAEWVFKFLEEKTRKMIATARAKNSDYTGESVNPFSNFSCVEKLGITTTEIGLLTRMTDKFCRIASLVKKGSFQVRDESIEDTLLDLSNYSLLLAAYIASKPYAVKK